MRFGTPWLLWLLPLAGLAIHFLYRLWGGSSEKGNNLLIDAIHEPDTGVPVRMAPLVLLTTLITHLFGGSAGREGTAVQMGGSMAAYIGRKMGIGKLSFPLVIRLGIAAGFGAVFGTPLAGSIFAIEVPARGKITAAAFLPCLIAAALGDKVCSLWGIAHTQYHIGHLNALIDVRLLGSAAIAGVAFGFAGWAFIFFSHQVKSWTVKLIRPLWLIPVVGGVLIIIMAKLIGSGDYLGLGVTSASPGGVSIVSAFTTGGVLPLSWLLKMVFTIVTLSFGFKGGEVTPLFFIGAALGNALSIHTGMPTDLAAGLGFIALFGAAANTPLACVAMGIELFGVQFAPYYAVACYVAFIVSGRKSIYKAQR